MLEKVAVCIIYKDEISAETQAAVDALLYPNHFVLKMHGPPIHRHEDPVTEKYLNCSHWRNEVRKAALETDAKWLFFLDADVVPPRDAIMCFMRERRAVMGGWYRIHGSDCFVAGEWVGDNLFAHFRAPYGMIRQSDMAPCGCLMMRRDIAEQIEFRPGHDKQTRLVGFDGVALLGECLDLGTSFGR